MANIKIETHFTKRELACPCGCGLMPDEDWILRLEFARREYGKGIIVASAARCPTYNAKIGGAPDSAHTRATAIDPAAPTGRMLKVMIDAFFRAGFHGFGLGLKGKKKLLHFDRDKKSGPRAWGY